MQLLWLWFLAVVAMATAQTSVDDFVVLADEVEENDLNLADMDSMEANGTVKAYLSSLLKYDSVSSLKTAARTASSADQPEALTLLSSDSSAAMFDSSSVTNPAEKEEESSTTLSKSSSSFGSVFDLFPIYTSLYYCPHRNYILHWFPYYSGRYLTDFCFIPYAIKQAITYAKCSTKSCTLANKKTGPCVPCCFYRRRIRVLCYYLPKAQFRWLTVTRSLATSCCCSARRSFSLG